MKKILILMGLLIMSMGNVCAVSYFNNSTTNIIGDGLTPETTGGTNVITLYPHYIDSWFSVYNGGHVTYQVYAYDYVGNHTPSYKSGFIMAIEPDQIGVLNNNASYYLYSDYDHICDLTDSEKIKYKFNQWWIYILIGIIIISVIVILLKNIWGRKY